MLTFSPAEPLRRVLAIGFRQVGEQGSDKENGEDVAHPIKAEPLAAFVADDVTDLLRDRRPRIGSRTNCRKRFRLGKILHHRERGRMR